MRSGESGVAVSSRPAGGSTAVDGRGAALPAELAAMLTAHGPAAVPAALGLLAARLGARSARLVPAESAAATGAQVVPLRVAGRCFGSLEVVGPDPGPAEVLTVVAGLLALALAAAPDDGAAALLLAAERDRDQLADDLHDGPAQALVAARYAADLAVRGNADAAAVARTAIQQALSAVRACLRWQRSRTLSTLQAALAELADLQRERSAAPLVLTVADPAAGGTDPTIGLSPAAVATAHRLVPAVLRTAEQRVEVTVGRLGWRVEVDISADAAPAGLDIWSRRVAAVGGRLSVDGLRLRLALPADTAAHPGRTP